jgi:uncharacterized protein (TIGR02300 family)
MSGLPGMNRPALFRVSSVARPELGSKHRCEHCGARFFDLNRLPIACPKCGTVVEGVPRAVPHAANEKDLSAGAETELVSLEETDVEENKVAAAADDEVEIDTTDDTFLAEEEEDDGDVGDLIDSDGVYANQRRAHS